MKKVTQNDFKLFLKSHENLVLKQERYCCSDWEVYYENGKKVAEMTTERLLSEKLELFNKYYIKENYGSKCDSSPSNPSNSWFCRL